MISSAFHIIESRRYNGSVHEVFQSNCRPLSKNDGKWKAVAEADSWSKDTRIFREIVRDRLIRDQLRPSTSFACSFAMRVDSALIFVHSFHKKRRSFEKIAAEYLIEYLVAERVGAPHRQDPGLPTAMTVLRRTPARPPRTSAIG